MTLFHWLLSMQFNALAKKINKIITTKWTKSEVERKHRCKENSETWFRAPLLLHRCRTLDSQTEVCFQFCLGTLAPFPQGWCGGPHKASRLLPCPGLPGLLFPGEWLTNSSCPSPPPEAEGWFSRMGDYPRLHPLSQLTNNRYLPHPCHLQTKHCLWPVHRAVTFRPV